LAQRLEQESLARHVSKSDLVRECLARPGLPPLKEGGARTILEGAWAAKVPVGPRRFRSRKKQRLANAIHAKKLRH